MRKNFIRRFNCPVLICLLLLIPPSAGGETGGAANRIRNVKVWKAPSHVRIVLDLEKEVALADVDSGDTGRFQVDIKGISGDTAQREIPVESTIVEKFSISELTGDTARISVWLKDGAEAKAYQLAPYRNKPRRVVIKIEGTRIPTSEEVFNLLKPEAIKLQAAQKLPVVVIDPGHGGEDPGALGPARVKEKNVVMDVAVRLKNHLNQRGMVKAVLTRSGDYYVTLRDRIKIAERHGASLFISLHTNASKNRRAAGTSVFYLSLAGATDEAAKLLADKENTADRIAGEGEYDLNHQDTILNIVLQMKQTTMLNESAALATVVQKVLKFTIETTDRGVRKAGFAVLKSMMFPSVLVELAFITNKKEERLLTRSSFKQKMAQALGTGIENYVRQRITGGETMKPVAVLSAPPPQKIEPEKKVYTVKKGDTLWEIGRKFRVSIDDILRFNKLENSNKLSIGQKLFIPVF